MKNLLLVASLFFVTSVCFSQNGNFKDLYNKLGGSDYISLLEKDKDLFSDLQNIREEARSKIDSSKGEHLKSVMLPEGFKNLLKYKEEIEYFCSLIFFKKCQMHPGFVVSLVLHESGGRENLVCEAGDSGFGQLLYRTAKTLAHELYDIGYNFKYVQRSRLKNLREEDLLNGRINLLLTVYGLSRACYIYGPKIDFICGEWNAGMGNMMAFGGCVPIDITIGHIGSVYAFTSCIKGTPFEYFNRRGIFVYQLHPKKTIQRLNIPKKMFNFWKKYSF